MSRLPIANARQLEKLLLQLGFIIQRQKGSHKFYKHPEGRYHIDLSSEDFIQLLNK